MSAIYGQGGLRRRSPYAPQQQGDVAPLSRYQLGQPPQDDDISPLMRSAMYRNQAAPVSGGGIGGGTLDVLQGLDSPDTPFVPPTDGISNANGVMGQSDSFSTTPGDDSGDDGKGGGSMDWMRDAPEAAQSEGFSTTPENRRPRMQEPITKEELPTAGKPTDSGTNQARADAAKKKAQIDKLDEKLGGAGAPWLAMAAPGAIRQLENQRMALRGEYHELLSQAQYEDNRRGNEPVGRPFVTVDEKGNRVWMQNYRNGQRKPTGQAPPDPRVEAARIREERAGKYARAREKLSETDVQGHKYYTDPETGKPAVFATEEEYPGPTGPGGETPGSKYSPVQFQVPGAKEDEITHVETDDKGNLTGITRTGKAKFLGKGGKSAPDRPEKPEKEDPIEKDARSTAKAAMLDSLRTNPSDQVAADKAYQSAYTIAKKRASAGRDDENPARAFDPKNPDIGTIRTSKKTAKKEIYTSTGWSAYTGAK